MRRPPPLPRIEQDLHEVACSRRQHEDRRHDEHACFQHREIARLGGIQHEVAKALDAEQRLDHHQPAEHVAALCRQHRDRRRQRIGQHVADNDLPATQPFQRGGARIVSGQRLDHAGPRHAGQIAGEVQHQWQSRQDEVIAARPKARALGRGTGDRQPVQPQAEDQEQEQPGDEIRDDTKRDAGENDQPIDKPTLAEAGDDACADTQRDEKQQYDAGKRGRATEACQHKGADGRAHRQRRAEVAAERCAEPMPVLDEHGLVGAELFVQRRDGLRIGEWTEHDACDIAGQDLPGEEDQCAHQPQGEQQRGYACRQGATRQHQVLTPQLGLRFRLMPGRRKRGRAADARSP
ncbi:hypothetical protein AU467_02360 [Mesorhizobium loti]|uniref:Uncharacterized protein n=1 Tax=Rhizobium loti TaxID=381 RepID=A0A101KUH4_RHILI|nr:hypothetical protein AU467_02360 [Mesorhizobium loti]